MSDYNTDVISKGVKIRYTIKGILVFLYVLLIQIVVSIGFMVVKSNDIMNRIGKLTAAGNNSTDIVAEFVNKNSILITII
ncbi:MAG: hypothetical protein K6G11_10600, partial [Lachnospiraceae bacterium]|nr:hypothetical protein [Lachnospiraceae bacterium]